MDDGREDVRELDTASPNFYLLLIAKQRHDEEAVIDQGRTSNVVSIHYEKEELEGESLLRSWQRGQAEGPTAQGVFPLHKVPTTSLARCHIMCSKTCRAS